jgi:predicted dienelactone hydrolase
MRDGRAWAACCATKVPGTFVARLALALVAACGDDGGGAEGHGDPLTWSALADGPLHAGYRTWEVTYTPAGHTEPRTIPVSVWYPTEATEGRFATYGNGIIRDRQVFLDAPLAPSPYADGLYPVHVYSHGSQGFGGSSPGMARRFATHGWVVVAPDHIDNTLTTSVDPVPVSHNYVRSLDVSEALSSLDDVPAEDPLAGKCDTSRVLLSGHSYGTHTVWASAGATFDVARIRADCEPAGTCTEAELAAFGAGVGDPRFVAGIPMAGAFRRSWFGDTGHTTVTIPMLALTGAADPVGQDEQWASTTNPMIWVDLAGVCHNFFAFGGCDDIVEDEAFHTVGGFTLAFGRTHVLGDTGAEVSGILAGSVVVSERTALMRR